jgi:outer membrane protein OmpA-like peptidoglycan-associated protein
MNLNLDEMTTGQIIRIDNLYFEADSAKLKSEGNFDALNELYQFLEEHPTVSIEVRGHTGAGVGNRQINHQYSEILSRERARSVANYLMGKGIQTDRIFHHGYGNKLPVSNNDTPEGRLKNQRVEIKILSI